MRSELFFVRLLLGCALAQLAGLYLLQMPGDPWWSFCLGAWTVFCAANAVGYVISEVREARRR